MDNQEQTITAEEMEHFLNNTGNHYPDEDIIDSLDFSRYSLEEAPPDELDLSHLLEKIKITLNELNKQIDLAIDIIHDRKLDKAQMEAQKQDMTKESEVMSSEEFLHLLEDTGTHYQDRDKITLNMEDYSIE